MSPAIRLTALKLTNHLPQQDFAGEIRTISDFVRDHIRYVGDVYGVETLHWPEAVLELGAGDCDDKAMLVAALLMSIRHRCEFVVLKRNGAYCHVWTRTFLRGIPVNLETTLPVPCGATAPLRKGDRLITWPIKAYGL